eukprot:1505247-Pleurochrysis_carterae.AAC.1
MDAPACLLIAVLCSPTFALDVDVVLTVCGDTGSKQMASTQYCNFHPLTNCCAEDAFEPDKGLRDCFRCGAAGQASSILRSAREVRGRHGGSWLNSHALRRVR